MGKGDGERGGDRATGSGRGGRREEVREHGGARLLIPHNWKNIVNTIRG